METGTISMVDVVLLLDRLKKSEERIVNLGKQLAEKEELIKQLENFKSYVGVELSEAKVKEGKLKKQLEFKSREIESLSVNITNQYKIIQGLRENSERRSPRLRLADVVSTILKNHPELFATGEGSSYEGAFRAMAYKYKESLKDKEAQKVPASSEKPKELIPDEIRRDILNKATKELQRALTIGHNESILSALEVIKYFY